MRSRVLRVAAEGALCEHVVCVGAGVGKPSLARRRAARREREQGMFRHSGLGASTSTCSLETLAHQRQLPV
jgi:hypothetical protein